MPLKAAKVTAQLNSGDLSLDVPVAQITGVGRQIHVLVRRWSAFQSLSKVATDATKKRRRER